MGCSVDGCEKKSSAKGLCHTHYMRLRRHGTTDDPVKKERSPCSVAECESPNIGRGLCRKHYLRWYETGSVELGVRKRQPPPRPPVTPIEDRFWAKVQKGPRHWLWTGGKTSLGYGMIWDLERSGSVMAHRLSWEIANGQKIPDGLVVDHLCRVPSCVNPEHLEVVTVAMNTERGLAGEVGGMRNRTKTHCPRGHPYSPENTYIYRDGKQRICKTCTSDRAKERRLRARTPW